MEGSGPPVSQELVYVRDDLESALKTLARLWGSSEEPVRTQIFDLIWDLAKIKARFTDLSYQARASE